MHVPHQRRPEGPSQSVLVLGTSCHLEQVLQHFAGIGWRLHSVSSVHDGAWRLEVGPEQ